MTFESTAIGLRRVRLSRILSVAGFVGLYAALACAIFLMAEVRDLHPALLFSTYLFWLVPWIASYAVWLVEPKQRGRIVLEASGAVRVERGGGSRVFARAEIASAQSVVRANAPRVEIVHARGDVVSVATASLQEADELVARLGFGAGGRRQRFGLGAPKRRFLHLALGFLAYQATSFAAMPLMVLALIVGVGFAPVIMAAVALGLPFVYRFFRKRAAAPELEIGDDGLAITLGNRPPRYLARKDVYGAQVVPNSGNIAVNSAEGPIMVSAIALDPDTARAALYAAERRWSQATTAPAARVAAFERAGRPVDAWRAELAAKITNAGYRGDGISVEEADAVVRNPWAPPEARVGAALALAAAGERLRIADAAAPVADARLRVALEAVAEGREEPALLEAATDPSRHRRG